MTKPKVETKHPTQEIISDDEIVSVHANANFGDQDKREVVNEALLKAACGYHNGHTAQQIITEHGLVRGVSSRRPPLTDKGKKYLYEVYCNRKPSEAFAKWLGDGPKLAKAAGLFVKIEIEAKDYDQS